MIRKTAKEILAESFRELAGKKNLDKITIREITDNCGYSPATFYRNFRDKYDLIVWEHTRGIAQIMDKIDNETYMWRDGAAEAAQWFYREKDYLRNLFRNTDGQDSFVRYMTEIDRSALNRHILSITGEKEPDRKTDMLVRTYCTGIAGLTCEWILGAIDASPEEITDIYEQALPEPVKKYLL